MRRSVVEMQGGDFFSSVPDEQKKSRRSVRNCETSFPALNGVGDGTRTHDNWNHNPGLYQLSYTHRSFPPARHGSVVTHPVTAKRWRILHAPLPLSRPVRTFRVDPPGSPLSVLHRLRLDLHQADSLRHDGICTSVRSGDRTTFCFYCNYSSCRAPPPSAVPMGGPYNPDARTPPWGSSCGPPGPELKDFFLHAQERKEDDGPHHL